MFEKFNLPTKEFLESLYTSTPAPNSPEMNVKMILKKLAAGFLVVVNRQLNDFLPGGKYRNNLQQKHHSGVRQAREQLKLKLQESRTKTETSKRTSAAEFYACDCSLEFAAATMADDINSTVGLCL